MTKTILIANSKGGVGKTTIATHLSALLANAGQRVLLVDAAPQGNAALSFGLKKRPHFHDWLVRADEIELQDVITPVHQLVPDAVTVPGKNIKELWMIRGNQESVSVPMHVAYTELRQELDALDDLVDYIIIDSDPSVSSMAAMLYYAADTLLVPTKLNMLDIDAVVTTIQNAPRLAQRDVPVLGIVPTFYGGRKTVTQQNFASLMKYCKQNGYPIFHPVRQLAGFEEASNARRMVFTMDSDTTNRATEDMARLASQVLKAMV